MFTILDSKFPEDEGYSLSVSYSPEISYSADRDTIKQALTSKNENELGELFHPAAKTDKHSSKNLFK